MTKIRILVVDDSAFMRKVITDLIESDPDLEVIGTARNGHDALDKVPQLKPDLVTLDVEMPVLDGLDTLTEIVKKHNLPVIMLSSTTRAGAENTVIALERGAFDFISKPSGSISLDLHKVRNELIEKVKLAYQHSQRGGKQQRTTIPSHILKPQIVRQVDCPPSKYQAGAVQDSKLKNLILLGTSTGGPKALQQVLTHLSKFDHTAILIVQHMPPAFTLSLAKRLDHLSDYQVVEAQDGELIRGGTVYIAPGGYHMILHSLQQKKLAIRLHQEPPRSGHRPSVDIMYESAMGITGYNLYTVIMTGMGKDGTEGLKKLRKERQVYSIAEDESSCIVYGMPRSAIEANLVNEVTPLDQIHLVLNRLIHE